MKKGKFELLFPKKRKLRHRNHNLIIIVRTSSNQMIQILTILFAVFSAAYAAHAKIEGVNNGIQLQESFLTPRSPLELSSISAEQLPNTIEPSIEPTDVPGESLVPTLEPTALLPPSVFTLPPNVPDTIQPSVGPPESPSTLYPFPTSSLPPAASAPPIPDTSSPPIPLIPATDIPKPPIFSQSPKLKPVPTNTITDPDTAQAKVSKQENIPDANTYFTKSNMNSKTQDMNKNLRSQ